MPQRFARDQTHLPHQLSREDGPVSVAELLVEHHGDAVEDDGARDDRLEGLRHADPCCHPPQRTRRREEEERGGALVQHCLPLFPNHSLRRQ